MNMLSPEPHTVTLPVFPPLDTRSEPSADVIRAIVSDWLNQFKQLVTEAKFEDAHALFREDAWFRDFLTFTWDFRTVAGREEILEFVAQGQESRQLTSLEARRDGHFQPALQRVSPSLYWIESMFDFETSIGRGSGVIRLVPDQADRWVAYALNFTLQELNEVPEIAYGNRPHGEHGK
ncbi:hypothetical protein N7526_007286 [Penicillium atrosanguineum]|nr:hypothetical protein N7526_007286 [Penicillium atrosanguineum]